MAFSWQEETYAEGTQNITVDIEYLDKSYIHLYLAGVETTDFTWSSDTLIKLNNALSLSTLVTIVRRTDKEFLYIKFGDGAAFIRENLDTQNTQFLHLAQELVEGRSIEGFYGNLSMNGYQITNLGTPVSSKDAVNKLYVDTLLADEAAARTSADTSLQNQISGLAPVLSAERAIVSWHGQSIDNSIVIPDNVNAFSIGPQITVAPGQEVTIGEGSYWNVLGNVFEADQLYNVTANQLKTSDGGTTVDVTQIVVDADLNTATSGLQSQLDALGVRVTAEEGKTQPISKGGTGATTAAAARSNLGISSMGTQDAAAVAITGGSVSGITDLAVADGGTGSSTAAGARTNLGAAASGVNSDITQLSNLTEVTPLPGVTTATNAAAGKVGEVITATGAATAAISSSVAIDAISIVLTPGDWDLTGVVRWDTTNAAFTALAASFNTVATTLNTFPYAVQEQLAFAAGNQQLAMPTVRYNVSANTTVYLNATAYFSSGSATARGYILARRVR